MSPRPPPRHRGRDQPVVDLRWDASTSTDVAGHNLDRGPDGMGWEKINHSRVASTYYHDSAVTDDSGQCRIDP